MVNTRRVRIIKSVNVKIIFLLQPPSTGDSTISSHLQLMDLGKLEHFFLPHFPVPSQYLDTQPCCVLVSLLRQQEVKVLLPDVLVEDQTETGSILK